LAVSFTLGEYTASKEHGWISKSVLYFQFISFVNFNLRL
jgi:hypothetical protein